MSNTAPGVPRQPDVHEQEARTLLAVVRELCLVMQEENEQLARRVPAGLTVVIERKIALSEEYERLWRELLGAGPEKLANCPEVVRELVASVGSLRKLTEENMNRLESAAAASRRRIEAVMEAIRSEESKVRGYGANGTPRTSVCARTTVSSRRA